MGSLSPILRRLPTALFRLWLPLALCLLGAVLLLLEGFDTFGVDAFGGFVGAGSSVWLTNVLWRIGVQGNTDRDEEEAARRYLARHGRWPDGPC